MELVDIRAAQCVGDAARNLLGIHAEALHLVAVEAHLQLGAAAIHVGVDRQQAGDALQPPFDLGGQLDQHFGVLAIQADIDSSILLGVFPVDPQVDTRRQVEPLAEILFDLLVGEVLLFLQTQRDAQVVPSHLIPLHVLFFGEKQRHPSPATAEVSAERLDVVLCLVGHHRVLDRGHELLGLVQRLARRHLKGQVHPHLVALLTVGAIHAIHRDLDAGKKDQGDDEGVEAVVQHPAQRAFVVLAGPEDHLRLAPLLFRREPERSERDKDQGDEQRRHQPHDNRQADSEHPERKHLLVAHQNQGQEDHHRRQGRHGHG